MKFKKFVSLSVALIMVALYTVIPVSAALNINGTGGSSGGGGTGSSSSTAWSSGAGNVEGYRISVYFAPKTPESSIEEPQYDWGNAEPIGKTIDVKATELSSNTGDKSPWKPDYWGYWSAWDYLREGGAFSYADTYGAEWKIADGGTTYINYHFNTNEPSDQYKYVCAIFNGSVIMNEARLDGSPVDYGVFDTDIEKVKNALSEIQMDSTNIKGNNAIEEAITQLEKSEAMLNGHSESELTIPMVYDSNTGQKGTLGHIVRTGTNTVEDLNNYLMHPTILNLLGKAIGYSSETERDFATDFYLGRRSGENGYNFGTYKIIVENTFVFARPVYGDKKLINATLQDIIACGPVNSDGASVFGMLGNENATVNMMSSLMLKEGDKLLKFGNSDRYLGDKIEDGTLTSGEFGLSQDYAENWNNYSPDTRIGNTCGLEVITSTAIGSYIKQSPSSSHSVNEICVSSLGDTDGSTLTCIQSYTDLGVLMKYCALNSDAYKNNLRAWCDNLEVMSEVETDATYQDVLGKVEHILKRYGDYYKAEDVEQKANDIVYTISRINRQLAGSQRHTADLLYDKMFWDSYSMDDQNGAIAEYGSAWLYASRMIQSNAYLDELVELLQEQAYNDVYQEIIKALKNSESGSDIFKQAEEALNSMSETYGSEYANQTETTDLQKVYNYIRKGITVDVDGDGERETLSTLLATGNLTNIIKSIESMDTTTGSIMCAPVYAVYNEKDVSRDAIRKWATEMHRMLGEEIVNVSGGGKSKYGVLKVTTDEHVLGSNKNLVKFDKDGLLNFYNSNEASYTIASKELLKKGAKYGANYGEDPSADKGVSLAGVSNSYDNRDKVALDGVYMAEDVPSNRTTFATTGATMNYDANNDETKITVIGTEDWIAKYKGSSQCYTSPGLASFDKVSCLSNTENFKDDILRSILFSYDVQGVEIEDSDDPDKANYKGTIPIYNTFIDTVCPLRGNFVIKDTSGNLVKVREPFEYKAGCVGRVGGNNYILDNTVGECNTTTSIGGVEYVIKAIARKPHEEDIDDYISKVGEAISKIPEATLNSSGTTGVDAGDLVDMAYGSAMEDALVVPTTEELATGEYIDIVFYLEEPGPTRVVEVYQDPDGSTERVEYTEVPPPAPSSYPVTTEDDYEFIIGFPSGDYPPGYPPSASMKPVPWEEIEENCDPTGDVIEGPEIPSGGIPIPPGPEQIVYILRQRKGPEGTPEPTEKPGAKFQIGQQTIGAWLWTGETTSKGENKTLSIAEPNIKLNWSALSPAVKGHSKSRWTGTKWKTTYCKNSNINKTSDNSYTFNWSMENTEDNGNINYIVASEGDYGYKGGNPNQGSSFKVDSDGVSIESKLYRGSITKGGVIKNSLGKGVPGNGIERNLLVWRGFDTPTLCSYAKTGHEDTIYNTLNSVGVGYGKSYPGTGYVGTSKAQESKYEAGFYTKYMADRDSDWVDFYCKLDGDSHRSDIDVEDRDVTTQSNLTVNTYTHAEKPTVTSTPGGGTVDTNVAGRNMSYLDGRRFQGTQTKVPAGKISFFPYVQMYSDAKDTESGKPVPVNVISKYQSNIDAYDIVEVTYREGITQTNSSLSAPNEDLSIKMESDMWSTHKRATDTVGNGEALAGGAVYGLKNNTTNNTSLPNGATDNQYLPAVGLKTYSWYVEDVEDIDSVVYGSHLTAGNARDKHDETLRKLKTNIEGEAGTTGATIRQYIDTTGTSRWNTPDQNTGEALNRGGRAGWLNSLDFLNDDKYWFSSNTMNGGIPIKTSGECNGADANDLYYNGICYKISSDTDGTVWLAKTGTEPIPFARTGYAEQDTQKILDYVDSQADWKDVNDKTGLVNCYLDVIIRNAGEDTTYVKDGLWYNEAFPGIGIIVQESSFNINMDASYTTDGGGDGSIQPKWNTVNLRYTASGNNDKGSVYTNYNRTFWLSDEINLQPTYKGVDEHGAPADVAVGFPDAYMQLNLRTKDWFIPNATVTDQA